MNKQVAQEYDSVDDRRSLPMSEYHAEHLLTSILNGISSLKGGTEECAKLQKENLALRERVAHLSLILGCSMTRTGAESYELIPHAIDMKLNKLDDLQKENLALRIELDWARSYRSQYRLEKANREFSEAAISDVVI